MAVKTGNTKNQVKEITDRLEQGMKDLFSGEKYLSYLQTMSRFHRYSTRNTLLIYMQKPDASLVAGYQAWQTKFGRYVKRGEAGIKILAPTPFTITKERQKLDPDTRRPILGTDGLPVTEEVEMRIARFKVIPVFDVSQTDGKPLPSLVEDLTGDIKHYALFMDALRAVSPLPIGFEPLEPGTDGICRMGENIGIRTGMSEIQTVSAVIHEITHAKLHDLKLLQQQDETAKPKDRRTEEVEAESVSYAVCQYYGIETAPNSFGYLAEWSKTRELKELNASLDIIRKTAADLIDSIDENFRALAKERGIDLTLKEQEASVTAPELSPATEPELKPNQHIEEIGGVEYIVTGAAPLQTTKPEIPPIDGAPEQTVPHQEQDVPAQPETDDFLPDPAIGLSERDLYGYSDPSMLPLLKDRALELYDADHTIYMLYPDNTEAMVFERDEIAGHDGIFGMEAGEWEASREYAQIKAAAHNSEASKEAGLIYSNEDTFGIYQLKCGDELHYHRWTHFDELQKDGLAVERANYELVYTAPLKDGTTLGDIVKTFNIDHPADFRGHSLSTSDVVVINKCGEIKSYYDDGGPFVELPAFLGNEKQAELDPVTGLAGRLDEFTEKFDPYGYRDEVEDREEHVKFIARDIENGELSGIKEMLQYAIEEENDVPEATALLQQLAAYEKPKEPEPSVPTVSELEEQVKAGKQISLLDLARAVKNEPKQTRHKEKPSILAKLQEGKKTALQGTDTQKTAPKRDSEREV